MIRYRYRRSIEALCVVAMFFSSACSKQEDEAPSLSNDEIAFRLSEWTPIVQSRAALFESGDDLRDPGKGGGNFTLYAHVDGTDKTYINGVRTWYFNELKEWIFLNSKDTPITYYWPNSDKLNFFAFMPDARYDGKEGYLSKETYVDVGSYTEADGQIFSCELPEKVSNAPAPAAGFVANAEIQEFIYAYAEEQTKKDNPVELHFEHPFALINFEVATGSYRMKINSIKFSCIHRNGEFKTATRAWTPTDVLRPDTGEPSYTMEIQKEIPKEENYNSPVGEPFLVMPQELEQLTFELTMQRAENYDNPITTSVDLKDVLWEPGKQYNYRIAIGDNNEEIYFNVEVESEWIADGESNIDVE